MGKCYFLYTCSVAWNYQEIQVDRILINVCFIIDVDRTPFMICSSMTEDHDVNKPKAFFCILSSIVSKCA